MTENPLAEYPNASFREATEHISEGSKCPKEVGPVSQFPEKHMDTGCMEMLQVHGLSKELGRTHLEPESSRLQTSTIMDDMGKLLVNMKAQVKNEGSSAMFSVFVILGQRDGAFFYS